jgi:hypothetical protein
MLSHSEVYRARLILQHAHESVHALLRAFEIVRSQRGAVRGAATDEEQDLLRAMLVMAGAGLDSMAKQVIRDTMFQLAQIEPSVRSGLETFITRALRGDDEGSAAGHRCLAKVLVADNGRQALVELYSESLTGSSLQSVEELAKTAKALGLQPQAVGINPSVLKPIFALRNKIIHELDINFEHPTRNRESRARAMMIGNSNSLLEVGENLLDGVEDVLTRGRSVRALL